MTLLAGTLYDPAVAVAKGTSAPLAMTTIDGANLRLIFSAPPSRAVLVRLCGVLHGAATFPQILLGVIEGGVVVGRAAPRVTLSGTPLATTRAVAEAELVISGLQPGTRTFDAAYGVELAVASTGLKYGGPNDATQDSAFGGFSFSVWAL